MKTLREFKVAWIALISLAFVCFLGKSYENLLRGIDSNIHAVASLEVSSGGGLPKLPIADPHPTADLKVTNFNDHPFFFFWVNGWVMRALGPSAWSARVLTASFSVGCVVLTFFLGQILYSRLFGFIAALFLLFSRDIILTGATVSLDPALMFFILLSFNLWLRNRWVGVGVATGVGLWFKTPVVLLVFPTSVIVSLWNHQLRTEYRKILFSVLLALLLGSCVWIATGLLGGWALVQDYWIRQLWGTAVGGRNHSNASDWTMPFRLIKNGFLPGLPFLVVGLLFIFRDKRWKHPAVVISGVAISIVLFTISLLRFRMGYYYNPIFPFLAILSSFSVCQYLEQVEEKFYLTFSALALLLMSFLLCNPVILGPEAFPALKRFMPLIQSQGTCEDRILLVPGGEPVGSSQDYSLVMKFYTGRKILVENCEAAGVSLRRYHPQWILASVENLEHCFSRQEREQFTAQFVNGRQSLLTTRIPSQQPVDFSPMEKELTPAVNCHSQSGSFSMGPAKTR